MLRTFVDVLALAIILASPNGEYTGRVERVADVQYSSGYLSAYNKRPTDGTTLYRQEIGDIPQDLTPFDARIAVLDCSLIGETGTLYTEAGPLAVIVFDCAGRSDGGNHWMMENNMLAEVDWYTWQFHPDLIGTKAVLILD